MTRQLIVNADDFGRTRGVSEGILRAHRDGIVTSTTAMMNMPGVARTICMRAPSRSAPPGPGRASELHGRPAAAAARSGCARSWMSTITFCRKKRLCSKPTRIDPDELMSELKSQITTFKNALGHLPDHLDAHHFVHLYPPLFASISIWPRVSICPIRIPFPRQPAPTRADAGHCSSNVPPETAGIDRASRSTLLEARSISTTDHFVMTFFEKNRQRDVLAGNTGQSARGRQRVDDASRPGRRSTASRVELPRTNARTNWRC